MATSPDKSIDASLQRRMLSGFAVAILLIAVLGFFSWQRAHVAADEADLVNHTYEVMHNLELIAEHVIEMHSSARGLALTGNKALRSHYASAQGSINQDLRTLRQLTADNPRQQQRLDLLQSQIQPLTRLSQTLSMARTGNVPDDEQIEQGEKMTEAARLTIRSMQEEELRLLSERDIRTARARQLNDLFLIAGTIAGSCFLLLAGFAMNRQIGVSRHAREEIAGLNLSLEQRVEERTAALRSEMQQRARAEEEIRKFAQELEQRVEERTADLQAANKELEAFTYSVSHDLRAPLRHIAGFSKMLAEESNGVLPPEGRHYLQRIQDGTHRMGALVDDLLSLTRIGRHELKRQVTGTAAIVKDVIADLQPDTAKREIEWQIGDLPYVEADSALLKVVFQNLLSNAMKYTRPRAKAIIAVGAQQIADEQVIYVRDNGVGFNMKYADKLFGVFQRLHRAEDFEGTGVGLATVQRIVQKHGGRIWVEAELDKGATFYLTLAAGSAKGAETETHAAKAGGVV